MCNDDRRSNNVGLLLLMAKSTTWLLAAPAKRTRRSSSQTAAHPNLQYDCESRAVLHACAPYLAQHITRFSHLLVEANNLNKWPAQVGCHHHCRRRRQVYGCLTLQSQCKPQQEEIFQEKRFCVRGSGGSACVRRRAYVYR